MISPPVGKAQRRLIPLTPAKVYNIHLHVLSDLIDPRRPLPIRALDTNVARFQVTMDNTVPVNELQPGRSLAKGFVHYICVEPVLQKGVETWTRIHSAKTKALAG